MSKKSMREELVLGVMQQYEPEYIWPWLLKPVAKTLYEWKRALQFEYLIFNDYLTPLGSFSETPLCKYSDGKCHRKVVENRNGIVVLECTSSENTLLSCECDKQQKADYEVQIEDMELYRLERNDILKNIAEANDIPQANEFPIAADNALILGVEDSSNIIDPVYYYLVCSNDLGEVHRTAEKLIYYKKNDFVMFVGHYSFIHDNTIQLLKKERRCIVVGALDLLSHMTVSYPPTPADLKAFKSLTRHIMKKKHNYVLPDVFDADFEMLDLHRRTASDLEVIKHISWRLILKEHKRVAVGAWNMLFQMEDSYPAIPSPVDLKAIERVVMYYDQKWRFCEKEDMLDDDLKDEAQSSPKNKRGAHKKNEFEDIMVQIMKAANAEIKFDKTRRLEKRRYGKNRKIPNCTALAKALVLDDEEDRISATNKILKGIDLSERNIENLAVILKGSYDEDTGEFYVDKEKIARRTKNK